MREAAGIDVGDMADVKVDFDPSSREVPVHSKLAEALKQNKKAKAAFEKLPPYRQKVISRYIRHLKTEESVTRNIEKVLKHLLGKERFAGRDL